jgi:hypothetical protein
LHAASRAPLNKAITVHDHKDTPEFRGQLKSAFKDGMPPS